MKDNTSYFTYENILKPLAETEDGSEWSEEGTDVFCLMLSRALRNENELIRRTAEGVIEILREKKYKPEWVKQADSYDDDMSGDNVFELPIPEPKGDDYHLDQNCSYREPGHARMGV